jgi:hypothetical protein
MKRRPGARLGACKIVAAIDPGEMGKAYRARDTRPLFRLPRRQDGKITSCGRSPFPAVVTNVLADQQPLAVVTNWKAEVK